MWAALSPLVLWLAAAAASAYEDGSNLFQWMGRFSQVLKRPFSVEWTAHTLKFMLVSLLLYGCGIALYQPEHHRTEHSADHGAV